MTRHATPAAPRTLRLTLAALVALAALAALAAPQARSAPPRPAAAGSSAFLPAVVKRGFSHIFVIVMENKEDTQIIGSADAPYLNSLAAQYARPTNSYGVTHPSFPNYLALTSGHTFGIRSDCTLTGANACNVPELNAADNLAAQLDAAGIPWKAYMESMPSPCYQDAFADGIKYAQKHNPFIYYDSVRTDPARCAKIVPFETDFASDLQSGALPRFVWITPNQVSDMHGIGAPGETFEGLVQGGDAWLATWVPKILASPEWQNDGLLVITFDEGASALGCCAADPGGGRIDTLLISPRVTPGATSATPYNHYSLLRTIEEAWGLPLLGHAADAATPSMWEFFPSMKP